MDAQSSLEIGQVGSRRVSFFTPRVLDEDWDQLEAATSSLRVMGANEIVVVLRKRSNISLPVEDSPLSILIDEFKRALNAVNRAFERNGLPYRLRREGKSVKRLMEQTVRLWQIQ